jgi:hypothetical protein
MIPKRGNRFSEKIVHEKNVRSDSDSIGMDQTLGTMVRNSIFISMIMAAALLLSGCGAVNSSLSETMADSIPHWAGGLPPGAPPRPTDPKYADYLEKLQAKTVVEAPKADVDAEIKPHQVK